MAGMTTLAAVGVGVATFRSLPRERTVAAYATSLQGRATSQRHNARLAVIRLDGAIVEPGALFSFNERVGTFSRDRGYRKAPVSYNGQLIDDWGGGVCQTSTTLYNAALLAGMKVVERHRHRFAPTYVPPGRDAAVAYSNIDLRFVNPHPFPVRIVGGIKDNALQVEFLSTQPLKTKPLVVQQVREVHQPGEIRFGEGQQVRMRNTGKRGYEVMVVRITGDRKELISSDNYPAMSRILERN